MVLSLFAGLALSLAPLDAHAGSCAGGQCTPVAGLEGEMVRSESKKPMNTSSSLDLPPAAHLRTATFALG